jgi:hypothetical protein
MTFPSGPRLMPTGRQSSLSRRGSPRESRRGGTPWPPSRRGAAGGWARDRGLVNLTLHTGVYNTTARAFYAALGFAEEEVRLTLPLVAPPPVPAAAESTGGEAGS